jgi:hypothetical protein
VAIPTKRKWLTRLATATESYDGLIAVVALALALLGTYRMYQGHGVWFTVAWLLATAVCFLTITRAVVAFRNKHAETVHELEVAC